MDKIWYRNPSKSEVIVRCAGDEKTGMTAQNRQKSNAKNKNKKHTQKTKYKSNIRHRESESAQSTYLFSHEPLA